MSKPRTERFVSGPDSFIVKPKSGAAWRPDGKPLDRIDHDLLAGKDPLAGQLAAQSKKS